ncbi:TetR/AcrR family transcriptional regulator [Zavarzinia aquatilis]|nr:TetR/AcrR family transcriptional regulator [Zavarzinia aquatilis]
MKPETASTKPARRDLKFEIGQMKRESILAAAAELFASRGYHNVSMGEVAEALGVTKPFVYAKFRDKNDLLFAICRRGADLTVSAIEASKLEHGPPLGRFTSFCRALSDIIIDNRTFITIYSREEVNLTKEQRSEIAHLRTEIDRHLAHLICEAVNAGDADALDPMTTATAIGVMISALWYWYRERGEEHRSHIVDTLSGLALRMIGARSA